MRILYEHTDAAAADAYSDYWQVSGRRFCNHCKEWNDSGRVQWRKVKGCSDYMLPWWLPRFGRCDATEAKNLILEWGSKIKNRTGMLIVQWSEDPYGLDYYYRVAIFYVPSKEHAVRLCNPERPKGFPTRLK